MAWDTCQRGLALFPEDVELGALVKAEEQWRMVVAELPNYRLGWRGLGDVLIRQGKLGDAMSLANRLLENCSLRRRASTCRAA